MQKTFVAYLLDTTIMRRALTEFNLQNDMWHIQRGMQEIGDAAYVKVDDLALRLENLRVQDENAKMRKYWQSATRP